MQLSAAREERGDRAAVMATHRGNKPNGAELHKVHSPTTSAYGTSAAGELAR
jgi:hypothetical protein